MVDPHRDTYIVVASWVFGYPFALGLMLLVSGILFLIFRRRGWL